MNQPIKGANLAFGLAEAEGLLVRELRGLADPRKAESTQRFFAEPIPALGIDTPTLRRVAGAWVRKLKPGWQVREARALGDRLLEQAPVEIRMAGILVLAGFKREFEPSLFEQVKGWLERRLDNWALVDGCCSEVLSPLVRRHPDCAAGLEAWSRSSCLWVRRASVVTLVPFARHGEQLDLALDLAGRLLNQQEDLMHKAVGWLLREAGKSEPDRLRAFLLQHRGAIPRTTVRYAIERFPAEERRRLLEETRAGKAARSGKNH